MRKALTIAAITLGLVAGTASAASAGGTWTAPPKTSVVAGGTWSQGVKWVAPTGGTWS